MSKYDIQWDKRVHKDIQKLKLSNGQIAKLKKKATEIANNPLTKALGGYGEPLSSELKGYLKFRFDSDYRAAYKLQEKNGIMTVIIIGLRKDNTIYKELLNRIDD